MRFILSFPLYLKLARSTFEITYYGYFFKGQATTNFNSIEVMKVNLSLEPPSVRPRSLPLLIYCKMKVNNMTDECVYH